MAHILVVDDDPLTVELVADAVEGHTVTAAADGAMALAYLDRESVKLILLDLVMPRMGGVEFAHEYRRRKGSAAVPIVLMSASRPDQLGAAAAAIGAAGILEKPFDIEELLAIVSATLAAAEQ